MNGAHLVNQLVEGGYPPEEIQKFVAGRRIQLANGGYSEGEINTFFGNPPFDDAPLRKVLEEPIAEAAAQKEGEEFTFGDAFTAGFQNSIAGMLKREKVPDVSVPENSGLTKRLLSSATTLGLDVPVFVGGFFLGAGAGLPSGPGALATGTASAFALPAGLRSVMMDKYENGEVQSFGQFWDRLSMTMIDTTKGFITGASVGAVGAAGAALAVPKAITVAGEVVTMVSVGAGLEGQIPEPLDFVEAGILIGGLRGGVAGTRAAASKFRNVYAKTGKQPKEVIEDAKSDPSILEDMESVKHPVPRSYKELETEPAAPAKPEPSKQAERRTAQDRRIAARGGAERRHVERLAELERDPIPKVDRRQEARRNAERLLELEREEAAREPTIEPSVPEKAVLDRISVGKKDKPRRTTLSDLYTDWVDGLHPLKKAVDAMREGAELDIADNAYKLARLHVGSAAKADHFLEFSPFKFETFERVGRPLKEVLEPVKNDLDPLRAYLVAKRTLELSEREIETGISTATAKKVVSKNAAKMEPIRKELKQYQDSVLLYVRDSGLISEKAFKSMQEANRDYVPFFRVMEDGPASGIGKSLKTRNPIKLIKGSEREIVDPLESIIKNTYVYIALAERNEIGQAFIRLAEESPRGSEFAVKAKKQLQKTVISDKEVQKLLKQFREGKGIKLSKEQEALFQEALDGEFSVFRARALAPGKDQIAVYRDGKRAVWDIDSKVYESFSAGDAATAGALTRLLGAPARTLRAGAIFSPEFIARNPVRDQLSAFIFSSAGFKPYVDFSRGVFSLAKKDASYQGWLKSGGPQATMVSLDRRYLQKNIRSILKQTSLGERARNVVKSPLEILRILSEASEQATRIGEFKRVERKELTAGTSGKEAARRAGFASREVTLDFGRIGARGRAVNQLVAFFNAQVQGVDKIVRTFKEEPTRTSARVAASITLPSVILHLLNRDEEGFGEIAQWQKDLFWVIPVEDKNGKNIWYRIPKPFELGIIFGSGAERIVDSILSEDSGAFDDFMQTMIRGATPPLVPQAVLPVIETFANRSIFLDRPIIPRNREKFLPEYQYNSYTTELTKAIGRMIAQVPGMKRSRAASPVVIDNFIRSWTGGLGQHAINLADKALRETGVLPDRVDPTDTLADIPFIKAFAIRHPSSGAQSINDFHEAYNKRQQIIDTVRGLARAGEVEASLKEIEASGGMLANVTQIRQGLSDSSRFIRLVTKNPQFTADEKRQIIDFFYERMIEMAKVGNTILSEFDKQQEGLQ